MFLGHDGGGGWPAIEDTALYDPVLSVITQILSLLTYYGLRRGEVEGCPGRFGWVRDETSPGRKRPGHKMLSNVAAVGEDPALFFSSSGALHVFPRAWFLTTGALSPAIAPSITTGEDAVDQAGGCS